jgi:dTDP-4-amino-4,6-dideoxygalactose transaminase
MVQKGYIMVLFEDRAAIVLYNVLVNIPQKKFLLPLNVCPIVPDTFLKAKKEFEFIDISLDTLCMDKKLIEQSLKNDPSIDGLLFVYTFGITLQMQSFYKEIKELRKDIFIIDDMCPCIQRFDYDIRNSYADMALFSSGYSKFVDLGYGGYGFVKDDLFTNIFEDKEQKREFLNYKKELITKIPQMLEHKEKLNNIYKKIIPKELYLGSQFNRWRFSILVDNKEEILEKIFEIDGLFASSHYPQVDYAYVDNAQINTNTDKIHKQIVNLFNDFRFNEEKALMVANIVRNLYKKGGNI